jgi:hypothetical protein
VVKKLPYDDWADDHYRYVDTERGGPRASEEEC